MKAKSMSYSEQKGFSLLELLTVIAIMSLLAAIAAPSVTGLMMGSSVTRAGSLIEDNLKFAHQYALSHQRNVEVRFYKYKDPTNPSSTASYRAFQIFEITDDGSYNPVTTVMQLPSQIVAMDTATYSTLLNDDSTTPSPTIPKPNIGTIGQNYTYRRFLFYSSGSTDLPDVTKLYFITMASSQTAAPKNYYTVSIDALNSKVTSYRP